MFSSGVPGKMCQREESAGEIPVKSFKGDRRKGRRSVGNVSEEGEGMKEERKFFVSEKEGNTPRYIWIRNDGVSWKS